MRFLSLIEVLALHCLVVEESGGSTGLRDVGILQSCLAQPQMTFGGVDLYKTVIEKAAALGFALVANHPFVDGNKRIAHAAMETFLVLNGFEIEASIDEGERLMLDLAAGLRSRDNLIEWLKAHTREVEAT